MELVTIPDPAVVAPQPFPTCFTSPLASRCASTPEDNSPSSPLSEGFEQLCSETITFLRDDNDDDDDDDDDDNDDNFSLGS